MSLDSRAAELAAGAVPVGQAYMRTVLSDPSAVASPPLQAEAEARAPPRPARRRH